MMKALFVFIILCNTFILNAQEVLELKSGHIFTGSITEIANCELSFQTSQNNYSIPLIDIRSITSREQLNEILNACNEAESDVQLYHGKAGTHIVLGLAFGGFATLGAALATPSPYKDSKTVSKSLNKSLFDDEKYLKCYRKRAKSKNVGNTLIG